MSINKMTKYKIRTHTLARSLMVLFVAALMAGCATKYGAATFTSVPEQVQLFDMEDGSVIGITPVKYLWRSNETNRKYMNIRMYKDGYKDTVKSFWLNLDHSSETNALDNPQHVQFELQQPD